MAVRVTANHDADVTMVKRRNLLGCLRKHVRRHEIAPPTIIRGLMSDGPLLSEKPAPRSPRSAKQRLTFVTLAGVLAIVGALAAGYYFAMRPVTLRIAVGPANSDDLKVVQNLTQAFNNQRNSVVRLALELQDLLGLLNAGDHERAAVTAEEVVALGRQHRRRAQACRDRSPLIDHSRPRSPPVTRIVPRLQLPRDLRRSPLVLARSARPVSDGNRLVAARHGGRGKGAGSAAVDIVVGMLGNPASLDCVVAVHKADQHEDTNHNDLHAHSVACPGAPKCEVRHAGRVALPYISGQATSLTGAACGLDQRGGLHRAPQVGQLGER